MIPTLTAGEKIFAKTTPLENVRAPLLVTVDDHFRIGTGAELMPLRLQLRPQLLVIVNFAIENDPDLLLRIRHRLMTARKIDDRQLPETQAKIIIKEIALVIGAPVHDGARH